MDDGVHMFEEFDGFKIVMATVNIGNPLAGLSSIIQVEHRGHRIDTKTIDVHFFQPEEGASKKEVRDFMTAVIEDVSIPMGMKPSARIGMFVERCPIKIGQRKIVFRKM